MPGPIHGRWQAGQITMILEYFGYVFVFVFVVFKERHHICLVPLKGDGGRVRQQ